MVGGWTRGDEPWNDPKYFDMKLPEGERERIWDRARSSFRLESGTDTTLNDELFPRRALELEISRQSSQATTSYFDDDDDSLCFVATSAYEGNGNHPTVKSLRRYRDEVLVNHPLGQLFIEMYYGGVGDKAAKVLDKFSFMKPQVRRGLEKLVAIVIEPALARRTSENGYRDFNSQLLAASTLYTK
ncbi:MAG TPA: CFI-box-CTERM domain-containing protein [Candidatus Nanoarchaeia archaeon]|nr:CFI-box-CTERM domain-containing protein [Candidatus Nanoarchaeia archaeon]